MKNKIRRFDICFLLVFTLFGCSRQSHVLVTERESSFSTLIPINDLNQSVQIAVDSNEAVFESGSKIELTVYNESQHSVYFDDNAHIRLLLYQDNGKWLDIKNAITYSGTLVLAPKGTVLLDTRSTVVRPLFDDVNSAASDSLLRIVIIGEILDGDTKAGQQVGAFVDVTIKP